MWVVRKGARLRLRLGRHWDWDILRSSYFFFGVCAVGVVLGSLCSQRSGYYGRGSLGLCYLSAERGGLVMLICWVGGVDVRV
jgi:hypothetical protein